MKFFDKFRKKLSPNNPPVCIYGPPEMLKNYERISELHAGYDLPAPLYGPPGMSGVDEDEVFRPENNDPVDIYGPPDMLGALDRVDNDDDEASELDNNEENEQ